MDLKEYFDLELRSTIIHAVIGAAAGYASFLIRTPNTALIIALVMLVITAFFVKIIWRVQNEFKWWLGNGIVVFLFTWFVVYTILYNIAVI